MPTCGIWPVSPLFDGDGDADGDALCDGFGDELADFDGDDVGVVLAFGDVDGDATTAGVGDALGVATTTRSRAASLPAAASTSDVPGT